MAANNSISAALISLYGDGRRTLVRSFALAGSQCAAVIALALAVVSCRKANRDSSDSFATSLIFDNASPDAREALATPVDFRITDDNFARWAQAQEYLDQLPRSAIPSAAGSGGNAIDRAVARLESSPRARTAIERTGLSVRDFVLETVALAQAAEAAQGGKVVSRSALLADNLRFVQRYQARVLSARAGGSSQNAASIGVQPTPDINAREGAEPTDQTQGARVLQQPQPPTLPRSDTAFDRANGQRPRPPHDSVRDSLRTPVRATIPLPR